jgi:hypothetical protein
MRRRTSDGWDASTESCTPADLGIIARIKLWSPFILNAEDKCHEAYSTLVGIASQEEAVCVLRLSRHCAWGPSPGREIPPRHEYPLKMASIGNMDA